MCEPGRGFLCANDSATDRCYSRDVAAIAGAPEGSLTLIAFANNHLQYALTWFGLAATLIGVFGAYVWQSRRKTDQAS